ncbi:hypothetical protein VHEMI05457 [[Torrubiella] hemipterigena]|uniref:Sulfatase N-terminal domain-containing protein n=1 Tax=[Torrubiella] hemipterigena TaxID=1531966 RepID=A0A0A1TIT9_9HYPO|nr:hypothetical protein VHEMI05457 [[Torrubiella] hemipterigena]
MNIPLRSLIVLAASRFANRRYVLAIAAVSLVAAKTFHIYAYRATLSTAQILEWGSSFFYQDTLLLMLLRFALFNNIRSMALCSTIFSTTIVVTSFTISAINIAFYLVAGSELHWRNIGLAGDSSSWAVLFTGLFSLGVSSASILGASWVMQDLIFLISTMIQDIVSFPLVWAYGRYGPAKGRVTNSHYDHVPEEDLESLTEKSETPEPTDDDMQSSSRRRGRNWFYVALYFSVAAFILYQFITFWMQPREKAYTFMSWAVPLLPIMDFVYSAPSLASVLPLGTGSVGDIGDKTAVAQPITLSWLPQNGSVPGFEDWYDANATHYRADSDPLKINNLDNDFLPELKNIIADVDIRHVMLIKLESTRKDVFPIKANDIIWEKLEESFKSKQLPAEAKERLSTLTPVANYITGDYDDGFEHNETRKRGGINAKNAHTTGTYTLKSLVGTLCGITPLVADLNIEFENHIYQPCLAQVFDMFNKLDVQKQGKGEKEYASFPWRTSFMQSTTGGYDKQDLLMPHLGYPGEKFLQGEYLKSDDAKFGKAELEDVNYYGMPEIALEKYMNDIFEQAKKNDERVFLTHLTSTAHHPFGIPKDAGYVKLNEDDNRDDLSAYANAIGYVDSWLGKVLEILDKQGVANETLLVFVGDHGLSIAEDGSVTPYYRPNIGNFHVPLVVSHPSLPAIDLENSVNSIQIVPTILDLLLSTNSLSKPQAKAATDLVHNYEGQSLIRPMKMVSDNSGQGAWQFSVMNTGRAQLAIRDGRHPEWRIVVPIVDNIAWRFTDVAKNPHEIETIEDFGFMAFIEKVTSKAGSEAGAWIQEAAFVAKWWVDDNARRYRYKG